MIASRTPFRVSLFGGGTDLPDWYLKHGGAVLGMAINRYCYITVRNLSPFFGYKHRIVYSKIEDVQEIHEIEHPAVRAVLGEYPPRGGLEIHHDGDLPARTGLGSSSSFTVGLLNSIAALSGETRSKKELAREAIRIEQKVIGESVGSQDQIWAAYGGFNRIDFGTDGDFSVRPLVLSANRQAGLMGTFMLFFTGVSRMASEIEQKKIASLGSHTKDLTALKGMVDDAEMILTDPSRDFREIGELLGEGWRIKRGLANDVSNDLIDEIYADAMQAGAIGGKILGAGGGGFILFCVDPRDRNKVRERLSRLIEVDFGIDRSGSTIVIYEPDGLGGRR